MAEINYRLLEHPAAQRKPETHDEWLNFVKVLVEYTSNPDAIDVAIEGGTSLANALPNASRVVADVDSLGISTLEKSPENRRFVPTDEVQFENSSLNGEVHVSGSELIGHVPEASTTDTLIQASIFGFPAPGWANQANDRGKLWWDEYTNSLRLRTDAPGVSLQMGRQVAYRILNNEVSTGTLLKGELVQASGAFEGFTTVRRARAYNQPIVGSGYKKDSFADVLGMVSEDIPYKGIGYAIAFGEVSGLDTLTDSEFTSTGAGGTSHAAKPLYLSDTVDGGWAINAPQRRVQIGVISNRSATIGRIAVNILKNDFSTFNGVSFQITGNGGVANPTIHKEFNVAPLGGSVITHQGALGSGTYRVTLNWYTMDWSQATLGIGVLDNLIENWTCKDLTSTGAVVGQFDRRAYITNIDATASPNKAYFDFTYFEVVSTGVMAPVELVPLDMTATDQLTFFGQLLPFAPPSG